MEFNGFEYFMEREDSTLALVRMTYGDCINPLRATLTIIVPKEGDKTEEINKPENISLWNELSAAMAVPCKKKRITVRGIEFFGYYDGEIFLLEKIKGRR